MYKYTVYSIKLIIIDSSNQLKVQMHKRKGKTVEKCSLLNIVLNSMFVNKQVLES